MRITLNNPKAIRAMAGFIEPKENRVAPPAGHQFQPGDRVRLVGLESFPEYNGQEVKITNIREDGENGRAYYIKGRINAHLNWVYEYRLEAL